MPWHLIGDTRIETKKALQVRTTEDGRTQNAEALRILDDVPLDEREPWIDLLGRASDELGGVELDLPARETARDSVIEE